MASNGIAGEFYVAAELTKRGMIATLTGKNTKGIDLLVANDETGKTALIQVKEKSLSNNSGAWKMSSVINERQIKTDVWYVFVDLVDFKCYVISAKEMFAIVKARKDEYDNGVKKNGEKRKPDPNFYFIPHIDLVDSSGKPKMNNWEDLPIFKAVAV